MDEPVDTTEIDEHTERGNGADRACDLLADQQAAEQLVALLASLFVEGDLLRQDETVGLAIDLQDLEPELAADERHELLGDLLGRVAGLVVLRAAREVHDLTDRDKAADAAVDDEATLVVIDDRCLDDDASLELLLHGAPLSLQAGSAKRQDDVALRRLGLQDVHEDGVADIQGGLPLTVPTEQLAVTDDAFALGADVDEDLVLVDADDLTFDHVAVLEALDVGILLGEQLLHGRRLRAEGARMLRLLVLVTRSRGVGHVGRAQVLSGRLRVNGRLRFSGRCRGRYDAREFWSSSRLRLGLGSNDLRGDLDVVLSGIRRGGDLRLRGGFLGAGGGLVCDGNRRDGIFGRLVGHGGDSFRFRRGPARLLFGQGFGHS